MTITNAAKKVQITVIQKQLLTVIEGSNEEATKIMPYLQDIYLASPITLTIFRQYVSFFVQLETNICNRSKSKRHRGCIPKCIYCNRLPLRAFHCCITLLQQMLLKDKVCRGYTLPLLNYSYKMIFDFLTSWQCDYAIVFCLSQY